MKNRWERWKILQTASSIEKQKKQKRQFLQSIDLTESHFWYEIAKQKQQDLLGQVSRLQKREDLKLCKVILESCNIKVSL